MIEVKFEGGDKLSRELEAVAKNFPRERSRFLQMEAEKLKARVIPKTPADTGRLRGAWQVSEVEGDSIEVGNSVEYASHVEYGHRIVAWGKPTGRVKPGEFMLRDAVDESAAEFPFDAAQILRRLFK